MRYQIRFILHSSFTFHSSFSILHSSFFTFHSSLFILHSSFCILLSSFFTFHSSFIILHSSFLILHSSFIILHSPFTLHHSPFTIHHSPFKTILRLINIFLLYHNCKSKPLLLPEVLPVFLRPLRVMHRLKFLQVFLLLLQVFVHKKRLRLY